MNSNNSKLFRFLKDIDDSSVSDDDDLRRTKKSTDEMWEEIIQSVKRMKQAKSVLRKRERDRNISVKDYMHTKQEFYEQFKR
jgi:hypothetical protein